jgi:hypothetical protein
MGKKRKKERKRERKKKGEKEGRRGGKKERGFEEMLQLDLLVCSLKWSGWRRGLVGRSVDHMIG